MSEDNSNLALIAILIDELKSEDILTRINTIKKLKTIALVLGSDRTRNELLPYILDTVYDEDEVIMALAEELKDFVPYVGGPNYVSCLLEPLEALAGVEETVVREKAVDTLRHIKSSHSKEDLENFFLPMLKRLSVGNWFTSRNSACGLFSCVYKNLSPDDQMEIITIYMKLCNDETPMVRRGAASCLGSFAEEMDATILENQMLPVLEQLSRDDQDSVRLHCINGCVSFCKVLSSESIKNNILPVITLVAGDQSWRVRCMVADKIVDIQKNVGEKLTNEFIVPLYVQLLKDNESEVISSTVKNLRDFCEGITSEFRQDTIMENIFPIVEQLVKETHMHVKTSLADQVMGLAPLIGSQNVLDRLIPIFLLQLRDDSPEVRLGVIRNLDSVNSVVGVQQLANNLIPAIVQLSEDKKWRVRFAIIEYVPLLAGQLGLPALNDDTLTTLCMNRLLDAVYAVREAAVHSIRCLVDKFGIEWAKSQVLPRMIDLASDANYLHRMICLLSVLQIGEICEPDVIRSHLMNIIINMSKDKVPNVRFKTAQILAKLGAKMDPETISSTINDILQRLKDDKDSDVSHYAIEAMKELKLC